MFCAPSKSVSVIKKEKAYFVSFFLLFIPLTITKNYYCVIILNIMLLNMPVTLNLSLNLLTSFKVAQVLCIVLHGSTEIRITFETSPCSLN